MEKGKRRERERVDFVEKHKTPKAAGSELLNCSDYQCKSAFVSTSSTRSPTNSQSRFKVHYKGLRIQIYHLITLQSIGNFPVTANMQVYLNKSVTADAKNTT